MIFTGNQRGGAAGLAGHLLADENDHVELYDIRGFTADTVYGALKESEALSLGTRCRQHLYSLSLNPPPQEAAGVEIFDDAVQRAESTLGLTGQPRVVVFHEKEGRRHAHAVWSRIDTKEMKAINIAFPKNKLMELSRQLYQEYEWEMPDGFRNSEDRDRTNFSHEEHQQAKRTDRSAGDIKRLFQEAWARSDSRESFSAALKSHGFLLAKGDRRGFVAVDKEGEVFSVARQVGEKARALRDRLGPEADLPSVHDTQELIDNGALLDIERQNNLQEAQQQKQLEAVRQQRASLRTSQREEREAFDLKLQQRHVSETKERAARFRTGLKGLWDRLRGEHRRIQRQNQLEAERALLRDQTQREAFVQGQLRERLALTSSSIQNWPQDLEARRARVAKLQRHRQIHARVPKM